MADLDPFVHMDQMGEVNYGPGEPKGTPWHPHRGFETVTYMIDGIFQHQDSIGGGGLITDGAHPVDDGRIGDPAHRAAARVARALSGGLFHGIQLWVNLPAGSKWPTRATRTSSPSGAVLLASADGGSLVRVIAGDVAGHRGPGVTHTPIALVHATLSPAPAWCCPGRPSSTRSPTCWPAAARVGEDRRPFGAGQLAVHGRATRSCSRRTRPGRRVAGARRAGARAAPRSGSRSPPTGPS